MATSESRDFKPLTFGKHKGKTPSKVAEIEPSYIVWMAVRGNLHHLISPALYKSCQYEMDDEFPDTGEHDDAGDRD